MSAPTDLPSLDLDPPLEEGEVTFLGAFTREAGVRRVWPGQPSRRCPWRPSADGRRLLLDPALADDDPHAVVGWLRFLSREFLAPSSAASLDAALSEGLRGGHRVSGSVVVGDRRIVAQRNRVSEEQVPPPEHDAIVIKMQKRPDQGPAQSTER